MAGTKGSSSSTKEETRSGLLGGKILNAYLGWDLALALSPIYQSDGIRGVSCMGNDCRIN